MPQTKSLPDEPDGSQLPNDLPAPSLGLAYTSPTDLAAPPHRMAYTAAEVGYQLNLGRSKTLALIADGTIRSVKIGRARRVRHSDLVAYIESLG